MKETYIITYPRGFDAPGGGTKSCLQIAHSLQKIGIKVILISVSTRGDGGLSQDLANSLLGPSASINDFEILSVEPNRFHYLFNGIAVSRVIRMLAKNRKIDAVIGWEHELSFTIPFLKSKGITFGMVAASPSYALQVNCEEKGSFLKLKKYIHNWFKWRPLKLADVVFVSSKFTLNEIVSLFHINLDKIQITYRGIDPIFSQIDRIKNSEISNFIFYGSFAPIKGLPDVISALGNLYRLGYRNWHLKIAGWGDDASIRKQIELESLKKHVTLIGKLEPCELASELSQAHLAILPSLVESFGRSIAEAQAAGLPVISYRVGSVPEIVEDGVTGWLVPPKNPELLAAAIRKALDNPETAYQMGLNGQQYTIPMFTWERTASIIYKNIQKLR